MQRNQQAHLQLLCYQPGLTAKCGGTSKGAACCVIGQQVYPSFALLVWEEPYTAENILLQCHGELWWLNFQLPIAGSMTLGRACQSCQERARTSCFCVGCARHLCLRCLGRAVPTITRLLVCPNCEAAAVATQLCHPAQVNEAQVSKLAAYSAATAHILSQHLRPSTLTSYDLGVRKYISFAASLGYHRALPAPVGLVTAFLTHCITVLELDSSTAELYLTGLSSWHEHAKSLPGMAGLDNPTKALQVQQLMEAICKHYKKASRAKRALQPHEVRAMAQTFSAERRGRHHEICFLIAIFACMRQRAAAHVRVAYEVVQGPEGPSISFLKDSDLQWGYCPESRMHYISVRVLEDKNHDAGTGAHTSYLPMSVPGLGVNPGWAILRYLVDNRPPSGGFLLAAPLGTKSWSSSPFSNMAGVFKGAFARAFPSCPVEDISSHSGRKTFAQLLHDAGFADTVIADSGGWALKKAAVHMYFRTSRASILRAVSSLG